MRLLRCEKAGWFASTYTFRLMRFDPKSIPPYAILSHRWGNEEVTLQDVEHGTGGKKDGYKKLEFCAKQAARDGLIYFWVDTCCIDKTNNTELSEAINSMFKWYQNAHKCYVYMPDVSFDHWTTGFEKSVWFIRGWTLQELLAPAVVEFFSAEGIRLGDKTSLEQAIHHTTGIPIEALRGQKPLTRFDEKERLSWTIRRETMIEEDAIYCLLGIFDVHIPLIYGEGREKALVRLQREIQLSSSLSPFIAKDAPWIVPFERNPRFTGRETLLTDLEGRLFTGDHTAKIAITGLGGVGKTQLVLELLYQTKKKHKDCSILWIPATAMNSLQQGYLAVAQQLGIPGCENEQADVKILVQDYLSQESAGPWVLVYDNADDIDLWTAAPRKRKREGGDADEDEEDDEASNSQNSLNRSRRLVDHLPQNKRGCIIFTTRDRKAAVKFAGQNIITVPELSHGAATQLLKKSLANPNLVHESKDIAALLTALTYLPLAITQATAYINANGITLADYIALLGEKEEETIEVLSEDFEDYGRYPEMKNPIATTWLISFEQIRRSDPLAAKYLSFIACMNPKDIPQSLLPPASLRKNEFDAIGTLEAYSFVSRRPVNAALDLHRLVHLTTRNWLRKEGLLSRWMEIAIARLAEVFPDNDDVNRATWRTYLPHALQVLASDLVSKDEKIRLALMWKCGQCLNSDGRWDEAETMYTEVLNSEIETLGEDHPDTLTSMNNLASTYWNQGRWEEAEQLFVQAMETSKTKLGADHPDTLTSMNNLALTYGNQSRWEEAEQLFVQAMETSKMKLGADHPDTLTSMNNLALTYGNQGRWAEAEQLQVQVMETRKTKLGADHPDTLTSMNNLASTYWNQGRWAEAEQLQVQVMETRKTKLGADHPNTLSSMNNLASTYWEQGRWEKAEQLFIQAMETRKTKLGADHPDTLTSMDNLALTYRKQGRWAEAEQLQVQVMETRKMKLGPDHPSTLTSINNLAFILKELGRDAEAIELMTECVQRRTHTLGVRHPDSIDSDEALRAWKSEQLAISADTTT